MQAIKAGNWERLDKLITDKAGPARKKEFVLKFRLFHTGASLLHVAILYYKFEEIAKRLVSKYGESLVAGRYRDPRKEPWDDQQIPNYYLPKFADETCLHLVIALNYRAEGGAEAEEKCISQLKFLIDEGPADLVDAVTTGSFFSMECEQREDGKPWPKGKAPYGETALNFAASLNMPKVVEFLVKYAGADMTQPETVNGWTPLHMAVMHDRPEMLALLEELWNWVRQQCRGREEQEVKLAPHAKRGVRLLGGGWLRSEAAPKNTTLEQQREFVQGLALHQLQDKQQRTPLILAAYYGKVKIFSSLWRGQALTEWKYATGLCRFYPLDDIEALEAEPGARGEETTTSQGATSPTGSLAFMLGLKTSLNRQKQTAFELITLDDENAGRVMNEAPFKELIRQKWDRYARAIFRLRMLTFIAFEVALFALLLDANQTGGFSPSRPSQPLRERVDLQLTTWTGWALWLAAGGGALLKLWMTAQDYLAAGPARFFRAKGSTRWERALSLCFLALAGALAAWYWGGLLLWEDAAEAVFQVTPFVGAMGLLWFLLGEHFTSQTTILVIQMMTGDFFRFLPASIIFAVIFALFFRTQRDKEGVGPEISLLNVMVESVRKLGDLLESEKDVSKGADPAKPTALPVNLLFQVTGLVLTNLLIAMMNSTCALGPPLLPHRTRTTRPPRLRASFTTPIAPPPKRTRTRAPSRLGPRAGGRR